MSVAESLRSIEGIKLTGNDVERESLRQRKNSHSHANDECNAITFGERG
jgi:hypothetical protein